MRYMKYLAVVAVMMVMPLAYSQAQVSVGVGVGPAGVAVGGAPVCDYGYYGYYPYACAPYGYYGADWFAGGLFVGAGPWFHGPGWLGSWVGLTDGTVVRGMEMLAGVARGAIAADTTVAEAGVIAAAMPEVDTLAATPVADSMAEQFTVAEAFTAQADSTVVAAMAADTADVGKIPNG